MQGVTPRVTKVFRVVTKVFRVVTKSLILTPLN